ncbi:MAG TPA: hypothetical protein DEO71_11210 [Chryseobacterium sp.]|nr:hypothetical protein [Chryseobacterium sp.]
MKFRFLYFFFIWVLINCKNDKKEILSADREAPLGWIYLKMYDDESFEFISQGMMRDKDIYVGNYKLKHDTLYFKYKDSIPKAGSKAIIQKGFVNYLNGNYSESLQVKLNNLPVSK